MKLNYAQIEQQIAKSLAPFYVVSGDEPLLKHDVTQWIRKAAKQAGFHERIRVTPGIDIEWDELYNTLHANSLFAEKRLIEFDFSNVTPTKGANDILQAYVEQPVNENIVVIDLSKLEEKITKSAWYKAAEKNGVVVTLWPISREQLPQWIQQRAKKYKLTFQREAANLLADYVEGNLGAAAQAIEKVYLLKPQQEVDSQLINTILTDESRFNVFDFIEHLISTDKARALHALENLKQEGTEPTLVLWGITRELRLLADLAQQVKQGTNYESLFQKYRIFFKRQSAFRSFLTRYSAEDCWQHLKYSLEVDRAIKGAAIGDAWHALQLLSLRVCG